MVKSKMAAIVGNVTGPQQRQTSIKYTSYCWEDQTLSTEGKTVSKYCKISKTLGGGGGSNNPHLYHGGGMNLRVRPSVNGILLGFHPKQLPFSA